MPPVTGPAWTSMVSGVNPGRHGIFDFVRWTRGGRRPCPGRAERGEDAEDVMAALRSLGYL